MGTAPSSPPRSAPVVFVALLLVLGAWEIAGRFTPHLAPTPLSVLRAAWTVATHGNVSRPPPPPDSALSRLAFRPLPYVMYGLKPSWTREPQKQHDGTVTIKTSNSLGFRGSREVEQPKPAGRLRIVCLGGSTTYSDAVSDDDAYPVLLEKELRAARPGRDIEVINAGVPSYTTAETLPNLAFRCVDLQPDLIVLYEGINDYRPRVYANFDGAYFHYRRVWDGSAEPAAGGAAEAGKDINKLIQYDTPEPNGNKRDNVRRSGTAAFRRNLVSIAGVAQAHGIKVVFVSCTWDPTNKFAIADKDMVDGLREHNQVVKEVAAQQGASFIDLAAAYRPEGQFTDVVHMNAAGSAQMARLIAAGLLQQLP
jgi:lysophospholipase L1-like esterase